MDHDEPIVCRCDVEKARRRGDTRLEADALVHLIGDDPCAGAAAMREDGLLLIAREGPAGRVVGRVHEQHRGATGHGSKQCIQIEHPGTAAHLQRHALHRRAEDRGLGGEVGPYRNDRHHFVARADQRLRGEHQRVDTRRRDGDAFRADRRMQRRDVARQRLAKLRDAEVLRVEGLAAMQRRDCSLPHELGRGLVALAEPEGQHVVAAHARVGDLADLRARQVPDDVSHGRSMRQVVGCSVSRGST